jgi:hypothetical protein
VALVFSIVTDPDRAERWASLFWRAINKLFRRGELRIVAHDVAGSLNGFLRKDVYDQLTGMRALKVRVKWVMSAKDKAFEQRGTLIVKLRKHEDRYYNVLAATMTALPRLLHPLIRPFISERLSGAVDLQICRKLAVKLGPGAENVYAIDFLGPRLERDPELRTLLAELLQLDTAGLFVAILLQELSYLGTKFQGTPIGATADQELTEFIRFLVRIATRPPGEEGQLAFVQEHIRVGVILVSKPATRALGVAPYVRRLGKDFAIGCNTVHLLASGEQVRFGMTVAMAMRDDPRAILEKEGEFSAVRLASLQQPIVRLSL